MGNCIVVVQFDLPKRTQEQAVAGGTGSAPIYRGLAGRGLIRKDYLNGEAGTGGVYLWESRAAAEAWFTEARIADEQKQFAAREVILAAGGIHSPAFLLRSGIGPARTCRDGEVVESRRDWGR